MMAQKLGITTPPHVPEMASMSPQSTIEDMAERIPRNGCCDAIKRNEDPLRWREPVLCPPFSPKLDMEKRKGSDGCERSLVKHNAQQE